MDRVLNICSQPYIKKELNFIKDILFGNGYPISLINTVIAQRLKMHSSKALNPTPENDSNNPTSTIYLPYIPKITLKLKKVCLKNDLRVVFTSSLSIMNLLNSVKDKSPVTRLRGVYQIPCICGIYYIGRTHQNLGTRLQQHKESIEKASTSRNNSISFDSALRNHIFENPNHYVLFDETILISNDLGTVREAIEMKRNLNNYTLSYQNNLSCYFCSHAVYYAHQSHCHGYVEGKGNSMYFKSKVFSNDNTKKGYFWKSRVGVNV